ncbi:conserved hypothetical protein [Anaeromyxobacter dehalogenans 2CP-1]|uniref:Uncharacterized protein n=1 Tax=Anaeromyxobacter dehalogenans (strain ATCC BAA-258 / DSM 21875 / 2CP-1) TaxID=455488 RepID=B8JA18_ANAD2|nr:MXAN_6577-like cysteine-rich protein [Anaeromyxobacter dehalogenans]ACL63721.1 conserved hypothetical protein [Anaeromyxobacter dehalogenans 2CP-1]
MRPTFLATLAAAALLACSARSSCPEGQVDCGGRCVALSADPLNCGACGTVCGAGGACRAGACDCGPGTVRCGETCAQLESDPANCGACGKTCPGAQVCGTAGGAIACADACGAGLTACDRACVDLASDRYHCGACGVPCEPGEACDGGTCRSLQVACFATDDVRPLAPDLAGTGSPRPAGDGPVALAGLDGDVWAAAALSGSLVRLPLELAAPSVEHALHAADLEGIAAVGDRLLVSNSGGGSVAVVEPGTGRVLDDVILPGPPGANPRGIAVLDGRAYVALYGKDEASGGQAVAVLDVSGVPGCAGAPCATLERTIDLRGAADAGALPFPAHAVALGANVYVTLANLAKDSDPTSWTYGYYVTPAGPGRLVTIDGASGASRVLSLGDGCKNPGALAAHGSTLWISCAGAGAAGLLPVDLSNPAAPEVGGLLLTAFDAPGAVAFCRGAGFVSDQYTGRVQRFDPVTRNAQEAVEVCPMGAQGWAWAADLLCAPGR